MGNSESQIKISKDTKKQILRVINRTSWDEVKDWEKVWGLTRIQIQEATKNGTEIPLRVSVENDLFNFMNIAEREHDMSVWESSLADEEYANKEFVSANTYTKQSEDSEKTRNEVLKKFVDYVKSAHGDKKKIIDDWMNKINSYPDDLERHKKFLQQYENMKNSTSQQRGFSQPVCW
jgi:hypothetical protein